MKKISLIAFLNVLVTMGLVGQPADSVKQIIYDPNFPNGEMVRVNGQQLKAKPYYDKGYSLVGQYEFKKAIVALKKAIEIDSSGNCATGKDGIAYSELGYAYTRLKDFDNAMIYLDKAIAVNKLVPQPYLSKAVVLMQQKNNDGALEVLNLLIKHVPGYAMGYVQRGFLFDSIGEYESALIDFKKYIELVNEQKQQKNSKAMVEDIGKRIGGLERKMKK
jgi:tetratricopeptide (TPR) repeat protein